MSQFKMDIEALPNLINNIQQRITALLHTHMQQQLQEKILHTQIHQLQDKISSQHSINKELAVQHSNNIQYLNQRVQNHQRTLLQYQQLHQQIHSQNKVHSSTATNPSNRYQNLVEGSINRDRTGVFDLEGNSRSGRYEWNESMGNGLELDELESVRVVCMIECQGCGLKFKPNSYYRHMSGCCAQKMINSLIMH